jgi:hypothetical protein
MDRLLFKLGCILLMATTSAYAQNIDPSRGVDRGVNYESLKDYGPWDDRNYEVTKADLNYLAPDEAELADPIPAFFRIELRKQFPHLRRSGPAQYPRAAVPMFYNMHNGLIWDGELVETRGKEGPEERVVVNGEIQLNQVLGANEVTVEINPANPSQVIAGSNGGGGGQEMYYSHDGGVNWTIQGTLPNTCCDPTVDWKSDGTVAYAAALSGTIGVSFWRSFDGGQTWQDRVNLTSGGSDKEFIHVDRSPGSPYQDSIYITYHNGNTMQFARSVNDGTSFDITAFPTDPSGIGSDITTTGNGDLYYFYGAFNDQTIAMLKSTDGGATFAPAASVASTMGSFDFPIPAMESRRAWIYAAADSDRSGGTYDGNVYVAWTDTTAPESGTAANNHTIIQVARSSDGGATWDISNPHAMDDTLTVDRFNQWIKVDEGGNVHVVFYDTRHSVDRTGTDFYYAYSTDGGATWSTEERLSSETSANLTDGQEWGDYNGVSILGDKMIGTWTDNRDGPPNMKDAYAIDAVNPVAEPTFTLTADPTQLYACVDFQSDPLNESTLEVGSLVGFTNDVALAFNPPLPFDWDGFIVPDTVTPAVPPANAIVTVNVTFGTPAGDYQVTVEGTALDTDPRDVDIDINVVDITPSATTLLTPGDGAINVDPEVEFTWTASAQANWYLFELASDPAFNDILISETVEDTSFEPDSDLPTSMLLYWRVSASNQCGGAGPSATFSFTTQSAPGDCEAGSEPVIYFVDDMEGGENGWTYNAAVGADTWALESSDSNSPINSWRGLDIASTSDQRLVSPEFAVPGGVTAPTLQFYTSFDLEDGGAGCYDGGILEYSTNSGASWTQVDDSRLDTLPYTGTMDSGFSNPLSGLEAWCGTQGWVRSVVDLSGLEGQNLTFRFRLGTDRSVAADAWYIDDAKVQSCEETDPEIIDADGFEEPQDP